MSDRVPLSQVVDSSPTHVAKTTVIEPSVQKGELSFMDDLEYHRMSDMFDIGYEDRRDHHVADKLSYLAQRRGPLYSNQPYPV